MKKAMPEYGEVFTVPVFHKRITFLIGPKVSEFFFWINSRTVRSRREGRRR